MRLCKEALGPDSKIMVDRTGDDAPIGNTGRSDWTHEEAMEIAGKLLSERAGSATD